MVFGVEELEKFCGFVKFVTEALQVLRKDSEFLTESWKIHEFFAFRKAFKESYGCWNIF